MKVVFGFVEPQNSRFYGLNYELKMKKKENTNVLHQVLVGDGKRATSFIHHLSWYVLQYTPNIHIQTLLRERNVSRASTDVSRSVSVRDVDAQNIWSITLGVKVGIDVSIYVMVVFQKK